jgi:hypothetical protein
VGTEEVIAAAEVIGALAGIGAATAAWYAWRAANSLLNVEKLRHYTDCTPEFDVRLERLGYGDTEQFSLWVELVGPPGVDHFDSVTITVRNDWRDRMTSRSGDLASERIAAQVWAPIQFLPSVDGADAAGRAVEAFRLQMGEMTRRLMRRTWKPAWATQSQDEWWRDQYADETTTIVLTCYRDDERWDVPHKLPPVDGRDVREVKRFLVPPDMLQPGD